MVTLVDLVVEAATGESMDEIARLTLGAGKDLMAISCGALLNREDIFALATKHGGTIYVPSGAIAGLDGVASASVGHVESLTIVTCKPPSAMRGAPGSDVSGVDLGTVTVPTIVYDGSVDEACRLFPANTNIAAALSMAGVGSEKTTIRIYADPTVTRNTPEILVEGEFGRLSLKIENEPTLKNPKTSALAALRKINSNVRIGT